MFDNGAAAPKRGPFHSQRPRQPQHSLTEALHLRRILRFDGDKAFRNDSAESEGDFRLITVGFPPTQFGPLHVSPVCMGEFIERREDLAWDRDWHIFDRGGLNRQRLRRGRRWEEHTSELQSPCNLVCRLLLEKK